MKLLLKSIILIMSFIVALAILQASAFARNGPHMGPIFPENTDACANCHRLHSASGAYLLAEGTTIFGFCTSCHNGTGANTNVVLGRFEGTVTAFGTHNDGVAGDGLNAGGYLSAFSYDGRSGRNTGWNPVTSRHNINGLDNDPYYIAWGGGSVGPGLQMSLDCTNCHDPHGSENLDGSDRYRILRNEVNSVMVGDVKSNEPAGTHDYTSVKYQSGIAGFCSACHTQYVLKASFFDAGDGKNLTRRVRHSVSRPIVLGNVRTGNGRDVAENMNNHVQLPVEQDSYSSQIVGTNRLTCLTCHQVHGSNVVSSDSARVSPANSTTLLRLKNRGVCQNCHQR